MRNLFFLYLCLYTCFVQAQIFTPEPNFSTEPKFQLSSAFIKQHRIKSVQINKSIKEDGQRIRSSKNKIKLSFDTSGRITQLSSHLENDSSETFYYYLPDQLKVIRTFERAGINAKYLTTDSTGKLVKEVHCREFTLDMDEKSNQPEFFKLAHQEIIYQESYAYENLGSGQIRKKTMNDAGIVYKEGIRYSNAAGKITEENNRFSVTGLSEVVKYSYNQVGKLSDKIFFTDVSGAYEEKSTFTYDVNGNIQQEQFFRNGKLQHELIYFYDSKGIYPEAILTKYPDRKTIDMQSFQIEFY